MEKEVKLKPILIKELGALYPTKYSKWKRSYNLYKCGFCGNEFKAQVRYINSGAIISCGCYRKKVSSELNKTHRLNNTRLNRIWSDIKSRTLNLKYKNYLNYGGRGITVCEEWLDIQNFYDWAMSNGYSDELSIDRIDNDGGYSPENCRWTTQTIQNRNRRIGKNNKTGYKGVAFIKDNNNFRVTITLNKKNIHLGYFSTAIEGAIAYNKYIIENNLEGFILNEIPQQILI